MFTCAECMKTPCRQGKREETPTNCPCRVLTVEENLQLYSEEEIRMANAAACVEAEGYCNNTRVEEIMDYAHKLGYQKIGVAFCVGLHQEARIFTKILRANGFAVESICCKNGCVHKERIGIAEKWERVHPEADFEGMCNPAAQAKHLCDAGCELAVILGLCVGHDTLFIRHAMIPVTVLAVKDRVLGHNPLGALYMADTYMKRQFEFVKNKYGETP